MSERDAQCPMCGYPLSVSVEKIKRSGKLKIAFFCEGDCDGFGFEILTELTNEDLNNLRKVGKIIKKEMGLKLIQRETNPDTEEESS